AFSAMAKQAAWAAANSSSGLVFPPGSPMRAGNDTGSENAPVAALVTPVPSINPPSQSVVALRSNVAILPPVETYFHLLLFTFHFLVCTFVGPFAFTRPVNLS